MTRSATTSRTARPGSRAHVLEQVRRVICVLAWFRTHPGSSLMTAAENFGVTVPQLRKELDEVSQCGLPGLLPGSLVDLEITGTAVTLNDTLGLDHAPALTSTEAAVVELNLEKLASILTDAEQADADTAAAVIHDLADENATGSPALKSHTPGAIVPDTYTSRTAAHYPATTQPEAATLALLRSALGEQRRWVRFTYLSVSSDTLTVREVIPDQLSILGTLDGGGYLWARNTAEDGSSDQRCYAVSRMSEVTVIDRSAPDAMPRAIDAEDPFGFREATDQWAELTLTEEAMWMLEYLPLWHIDDTRVEIPDTGRWLERFLLAYSPEITAVQPPEVAERVVDRVAEALATYHRLT